MLGDLFFGSCPVRVRSFLIDPAGLTVGTARNCLICSYVFQVLFCYPTSYREWAPIAGRRLGRPPVELGTHPPLADITPILSLGASCSARTSCLSLVA